MRITRKSNGGLERLIARLERVAKGAHRRPVAEAVGKAAVQMVNYGFAAGQAPSGAAWQETEAGNAPLIGETRELSTSAEYEPSDSGVKIIVKDDKAGFHQGGTSRGIPARPMLPEGELPGPWRGPIEEAGVEALRKVIEGS